MSLDPILFNRWVIEKFVGLIVISVFFFTILFIWPLAKQN